MNIKNNQDHILFMMNNNDRKHAMNKKKRIIMCRKIDC